MSAKVEIFEPSLSKTAKTILEKRYYKPKSDGSLENFQDLSRRVANAIAHAEEPSERLKYARIFDSMLMSLEFLPNSPTLMNAGTHKGQIVDPADSTGQLAACFVLPVKDSISSIFETIGLTAKIHKSGGGTGFSFSSLRPKNDFVGLKSDAASGPLSFMTVFDKTTDVIKQGGARRGANMAVIRVDHPDVEEIIDAKINRNMLNNFNISIDLTKAFMEAVISDSDYDLVNPRTSQVVAKRPAREVFKKIVQNAWENGEPGIIFMDRINEVSLLGKNEKINATNPCVVGTTLVAVADGRVTVPIAQLAEEGKDVPVYSRNSKGSPVIRMMRNPRITNENAEVVRVVLDDGNSVTVTKNHRFVLTDGREVEASKLQVGDSLSLLTRWEASFSDFFTDSSDTSSRYAFVNTTNKPSWLAEHTLFETEEATSEGRKINWRQMVVHHRDFNGLNNSRSNRQLMLKTEHTQYHAERMTGENNPVNRFPEKNWMNDPEKQRQFRDRVHVGAKRSESTKSRIGQKTAERFNDADFREKHIIGTREGMQKWLERVLPERAKARLEEAQTLTDLPVYLDPETNIVMVTKTCANCNESFSIPFYIREKPCCSTPCSHKYSWKSGHRRLSTFDGHKQTLDKKAQQTKQEQIRVLLDLKTKLGKIPMIKEWYAECASRGIPHRFGSTRSFQSFNELLEASKSFNHRVVAVEPVGTAAVYNGTVDEFHNYYIGAFETKIKNKPALQFVNTLNCGEQPLPDNSSCCLGSINLSKMLSGSEVDFQKLEAVSRKATRFLDNLIDVNSYPDPRIEETTKKFRQIGIGVMGWADLLSQLGIPYGSTSACNLAEKIMSTIQLAARDESSRLAKLRGNFPAFEDSEFPRLGYSNMRNATVTTIAPTGTISIIAGASSGIEPHFTTCLVRKQADEVMYEINPVFKLLAKKYSVDISEALISMIADNYGSIQSLELPSEFKKSFQVSYDIDVQEHIQTQVAFQKHTDNAVSKTINMPNSAKLEDVENAYLDAWKFGLKGLTVYRDGSRDQQVLSTGTASTTQISDHNTKPDVSTATQSQAIVRDRPMMLQGSTYRYDTGCGPIFITINEDETGLFELFTTMGKAGGCAASQSEAIGRLTSLSWRAGVPAKQVVKQLSGIACHKPSGFGGNKILSCADAVAKAIAAHIELTHHEVMSLQDKTILGACPECASVMEPEGGCSVCTSCGYSACS